MQEVNNNSYYPSYTDEGGMNGGENVGNSNYQSQDQELGSSDYGNFLRIHDRYDTGYEYDPDVDSNTWQAGGKKVYVHEVSKDYDHVMQDIEDSYEVHLHFWVKFSEINFNSAFSKFGITQDQTENLQFEICFLAFGPTEKCKNLTFSINKDRQQVVKFTPGDVTPKDIDRKRYYFDRSQHFVKVVTDTKFKLNKDYFIDFAFYKYAQLSETQLYINCKRETSLSFSNRPIIRFKKVVFGSEVHSYPFEGAVSDVAIVYNNQYKDYKKSNWGKKLERYYRDYGSFEPGSRLDCLEVDCDLRNCVNLKHDYYGVPKAFLKKYEYNEEFKSKMLASKLKMPVDTMEPVNPEQAFQIAHDIIGYNEMFKDKLKAVIKSKKWAYKSMHLYSPHIQCEQDYNYSFMTINTEIAKDGTSKLFEFPLWTMDSNKMPVPISRKRTLEGQFPLYCLDSKKMFKILNHIKIFDEYDENQLHHLAMCASSVFVYSEKKEMPNTKKKVVKETYCYLYKKLFDFIENILIEMERAYGGDDMTTGPEEISQHMDNKIDEVEEDDMKDYLNDSKTEEDTGQTGTKLHQPGASETRKEKMCLWNKNEDFQSVYNDFYDYYEDYMNQVHDPDLIASERPIIGWLSIVHSKHCVYRVDVHYLNFKALYDLQDFEMRQSKYLGDIMEFCCRPDQAKETLEVSEEKNLHMKETLQKQDIEVTTQTILAPRDDFEPKNVKRLTNINMTSGKKIKCRMTGERIWKIKATQEPACCDNGSKKNKMPFKNLLKLDKPPKDLFENAFNEDKQVNVPQQEPPKQTEVKSNTKVKLTIKGGQTTATTDRAKKDQAKEKLDKSRQNDTSKSMIENDQTAWQMEEEAEEEVDVVKRYPPKQEQTDYRPKNPYWKCQYLYVSINKECQINRFCLFKNLDDFLEKFEITL